METNQLFHAFDLFSPRAAVWLRWAAVLFLIILLPKTSVAQSNVPTAAQMQEAASALHTQLITQGALPLIIQLDVPGYDPAAFDQVQAASVQEAAVATAQDALLGRMAQYVLTNVKTFPYIPYLALTVHDPAALEALRNDPAVLAIEEDRLEVPLLTDSIPLIRADSAQSLFYRGNGQVVVVLDTGVDKNHAALVGKVVAEACYSTTNATFNSTAICPGGTSSSTANNAGLNCTASINGCDHGTHVAGIAAAVAPDAQIMSMQVFSRMDDNSTTTPCANSGRPSPCTQSFVSDQLSALNRVYALRNSFNIASINMSLGAGQNSLTCDNDSRKSIIELLRGAGIATVVSAGNSSYRSAMGAPACISATISVGATTKTDLVASYSNLSNLTTLLAPGSDINSTVPSNQFDEKNGTSMAAPHVAGAIAVLKQALPTVSVTQLRSALQSTGPLISDQRAGGTVSKRRLDVYSALCQLITCDSDDYRYLNIPQTVSGNINPANDRDHYFIYNVAGTQVTLHMDRTSGSLDPYLELYDPNGNRVALNNNGGTGSNALINGYTFQQTGRYQLIARSANSTVGGYSLRTSQQSVILNPLPQISSLSPSSATGTFTGSDFWVQIRGSGFTPQTLAYWNGQSRTPFYSSSTRMWIRVRGSDLGLPWPRGATIQVRNPEPGGGYSNPRTFNITFPFLGTSELIQPESGATVVTGIQTTFVLSWTHPSESWRTMQQMDLRLRDQNNKVAAWIRVVERPGATSVYRLLNGAEVSATVDELGTPDEGLPGEARNLVITDTVTLHLAASAFAGSGRTAIMTPTVTFGSAAVGVYNIEFQVDSPDGAIQADDVLGQIQIVPGECPFAVERVTVSGATDGVVNTPYTYSATVEPVDATAPISYTWSPEPASGQGTANATYAFAKAGDYPIFLGVENCGSFAADLRSVQIHTSTEPDLAIHKAAPATTVAGAPLTYTLTITNSG
ncbi:MAG: S8 family serine peptidase, partial [Caldilineaceae bacterium]|nr:S8 family serine peptidase [Caldilineaceae bacterium]